METEDGALRNSNLYKSPLRNSQVSSVTTETLSEKQIKDRIGENIGSGCMNYTLDWVNGCQGICRYFNIHIL